MEHLIMDVVGTRAEGDALRLDLTRTTQTCLTCSSHRDETDGPCPLDTAAAPSVRPDWQTMSALAFTAVPKAVQPAMFAVGGDAMGTLSLLEGEDGIHLF
ncbi:MULTISPECIES: hypothetical protein [Streptacidiphilus]|uniref:Uncharacterized protein n=1 Tax=Streptacidiphilus cavernicola TaxID=3342716 RepID=A0ABV6UWF6_9ACTN|nr:hypothetical protein [Streptacidiphilus jeojiense]